MDYKPRLKTEPEINLIDVIWGLLSQWKAVFVVSLIMALLLTGLKYYKDTNAYNASVKNQEEIEAMSKLSPEEQISSILEGLSEEDRLGVEYVIKQKEWLAKGKSYLRDSILMNTDPTNQRTLILDYYIKATNASEATRTALDYGYLSFANEGALIAELQQIISPESDSNFISELVSVKNNSSNGMISTADSVVEIQVVLPDDVDADAVQGVVNNEIEKFSNEISEEIGPHELRLINASEARLYNQAAADRRTNLNTTTYNINYNLGNLESALSEQQRVAMNSILEIKKQQNAAENAVQENVERNAEEVSKPGISKKFALVGFVLGIILYAIVYILYCGLKGNITSPEQTERYSNSRLLGEIYYKGTHKGLKGLLNSSIVNGIRCRGKKDTAKQISYITSTIDAVCRKNDAAKVTAMCLPGISAEDHAVIRELEASIKKKGVDLEIIDVDFATVEEKLLSIDFVVCVANEESKAADLINLASLLKSYDTKIIGNVFIQGV